MRKCDSCGKLYQETKDVFCPHCGAVAVKQCTHGSSFDSGRYDRGEIYKNSNTQRQNTTYNQGYEPHVQRGSQPYKKNESNEGYGNKVPQINFPDLTKMMPKVNKKGNPKIGIIVFVCVLAFNIIIGSIGSGDYTEDNEAFWEDVSVQEEYIGGDASAIVKNASVELVEDNEGIKTFDISIENMYFTFDSVDYRNQVREGIVQGNAFVEIDMCVFSENPVSEEDFDDALSDSYYISGNECAETGRYQFELEFDYGEIIYLNSGLNMYLENDMNVCAELPFGAFSISEDGTVTYYTSYASDETDWKTVFEECSNEADINGYSGYINFNKE
ncbi:MAG: hypothetical protein IJN94_07310 [Clostridia bacterium]|nr:hypothetical protein [Clostridia bacterium]